MACLPWKLTLEILVLIWVWNPCTGGKYAKDNFRKRSVPSQDEESGEKTKNKTNTAYEFNSCEV